MHGEKYVRSKAETPLESSAYLGLFFCLLLSFYFFRNLFVHRYIDGLTLILMLFFIGVAIVFLDYLFNKKKLFISEKGIIVKGFLKNKKIPKKEIIGFRQKVYKAESSSDRYLVFKTQSGYLKIKSDYYGNYYSILKITEKYYTQLEDSEFKKFDYLIFLPFKLLFFSVACLFVGWFVNVQLMDYDEIPKWHYTEVTLSEVPTIKKSSSKPSSKYIAIKTKEFPEFNFKISGYRFRAFNIRKIQQIKKGDKVLIGGTDQDIQGKLLGGELDFSTKYFDWGLIQVESFIRNKEEYIPLDSVSLVKKRDRWWSWILLLLGLTSLFMSLANEIFWLIDKLEIKRTT